MPNLNTKEPNTFNQYIDAVEQIRSAGSGTLWFRGCHSFHHKLTPSLYRHPDAHNHERTMRLEKRIVARFQHRSLPFVGRTAGTMWDTLFLMQHHGVPTRLLDWTESPFVALFFSVIDAPKREDSSGRRRIANDSVVWVLDPAAWNRTVVPNAPSDDFILSPIDTAVSPYESLEKAEMPDQALAITGIHNSQRIVSQRGVFTVFGKVNVPMEQTFTDGTFPASALVRIRLRKRLIIQMAKAVLDYGITDSVTTPSTIC